MSLSSAEGPMGLRGEQRTAPLDEYQYIQESIVYSLYLMLHTYREEHTQHGRRQWMCGGGLMAEVGL